MGAGVAKSVAALVGVCLGDGIAVSAGAGAEVAVGLDSVELHAANTTPNATIPLKITIFRTIIHLSSDIPQFRLLTP